MSSRPCRELLRIWDWLVNESYYANKKIDWTRI